MNYQHLKYFQAVARRENYQLAAQDLYITQPTLSRAIANLESEIGFPLFEKQGRNIRITAFGKAFLAYVNSAIESIDEGVQHLRNMANSMEGCISISAIYGFFYNQLPALLSEFNEKYPHVTFKTESTTSVEVIQHVHDERFDIGFHCGTPKMQYYPALESYQLTSSELVVITSKEHPLAGRGSVYLKELEETPYVSFSPDAGSYSYIQQMFSDAGADIHTRYMVSDDQGILNMVANNLAFSTIIEESVRNSQNVSLLRILDDVPKTVPIYISLKRKQHSLILETFLQRALDHYQFGTDK